MSRRRPLRAWVSTLAPLLAAALGAPPPAAAQEVEPRVSLSPEVAGLEEAVKLEVTVEGASLQSLHFDASFQLENLRRIGGPSQSTSIRIINGVPSSSRSLTWYLQPAAVGTARVRSIVVAIGQRELELGDREITVQQEIPEERRQRRRTDPFGRVIPSDPFEEVFGRRRRPSRRPVEAPKIWLRAEASPSRPYVGEQVHYTLYLYTQADISSVSPAELPDFKGCWVREIPQDERQPEMIEHQGESVARVVLLQRALFPRREGRLELGPVRADMVAKIPDDGPFGPLFARSTQISRESNPLALDVRPLPEPPPGFEGAVGKLSLEASLEPGELAVGEAATLTLELAGRGHLQGIPEPRLPELPGVQVFPPQQTSDERLRGKTVYGKRTWSFVLVPQRPGEVELPPIEIPYFDPRAGRYETASVSDLALSVRGPTSLPQEGGESVVELHPIRTAALPASGGGEGLSAALPWLFGLPWGLALVVLLARRGGGGRLSRPARRRFLERLARAAAEERPRQAAAEIEEAWRGFLEERFGLAPGTPSTRWAAQLAEKGADPRAAEELVKLADDLHYLRYAPKLSSTADLRGELVERSRKLLKALA